MFSIKGGVRQGRVCSCLLFNLYVNEFIVKLQESGYGCKLWGEMLKICFIIGYGNDLLFNAKISAYFAFGDLHLRASKAEMYIGEEKNSMGICV